MTKFKFVKHITFLAIITFNFLYPQLNTTGVVEYARHFSAIYPKKTSFKLHFNNEFSFLDELYTKEEYENRNKGVPKYIQEIYDVGPEFENIYYFFDFGANKLYFKSFLLLEYATVEDDLRFEWEIRNETKSILGYKCLLARSKIFRGRTYEAWFTTQIPVPFGPWKVNGLPGIILEFYDLDKLIHFEANQIYLNEVHVDFYNLKEKIINENPLSIDEYVLLKNDLNKQFLSLIESRLPQGMGSVTSHDKTEIEIYE